MDGSTGCSTNVEHPPNTAAKSSAFACMVCEKRGAGGGGSSFALGSVFCYRLHLQQKVQKPAIVSCKTTCTTREEAFNRNHSTCSCPIVGSSVPSYLLPSYGKKTERIQTLAAERALKKNRDFSCASPSAASIRLKLVCTLPPFHLRSIYSRAAT